MAWRNRRQRSTVIPSIPRSITNETTAESTPSTRRNARPSIVTLPGADRGRRMRRAQLVAARQQRPPALLAPRCADVPLSERATSRRVSSMSTGAELIDLPCSVQLLERRRSRVRPRAMLPESLRWRRRARC